MFTLFDALSMRRRRAKTLSNFAGLTYPFAETHHQTARIQVFQTVRNGQHVLLANQNAAALEVVRVTLIDLKYGSRERPFAKLS